MTQQRLDEIRARCEAATLGPWIYDKRVGCVAVYHGEKACCIDETEGRRLFYADGFLEKEADGYTRWKTNPADCTNAAFIAHARQDIPALLAEVERLQSFRDRIITLPSCCSCGSKGGCPHEPLPGMYERINCPLWIGRKEG